MIFTMVISCLFFIITCYFSGSDDDLTKINPKYSDAELYKCIDNLSYKPVVIMAHSNVGPKLIYYTKHFVLGSPYHRQIEGIALSYAVTRMDNNIKTVRKILKRTNTHFILVSHNQQTAFPKSFASTLLAGNLPKWISIIKIPEKFYDHSVFKVDQDLLTQEMLLEGDWEQPEQIK
jgi:hypothetical protein